MEKLRGKVDIVRGCGGLLHSRYLTSYRRVLLLQLVGREWPIILFEAFAPDEGPSSLN